MSADDPTLLGLARLLADLRLHVEALSAENAQLRAWIAEHQPEPDE